MPLHQPHDTEHELAAKLAASMNEVDVLAARLGGAMQVVEAARSWASKARSGERVTSEHLRARQQALLHLLNTLEEFDTYERQSRSNPAT